MNKRCPLCDKWYIDKFITVMNLDEPEFRGYCYKCRKKLKQDAKVESDEQ